MWDSASKFADMEKFSLFAPFTPFVFIPLKTIFRAKFEGICKHHILIFYHREKEREKSKEEGKKELCHFSGGRTPTE